MTITLDKEVANNPKTIADMIMQLTKDIDNCKGDLSEIKDRGVFKRFFSNNTKDLADAMIKQNDTISLFLNIIQSIIMLHMHNTVVLGKIQEHLHMYTASAGDTENKYTNMAKEFITQSYNAALTLKNKIDKHENAVCEIMKQLIDKDKIDEEQSYKIAQINTQFEKHELDDEEQDKKISELENAIEAKSIIDSKQDQVLSEISSELLKHDSIDTVLSHKIDSLNKMMMLKDDIDKIHDATLNEHQGSIANINNKTELLKNQLDKLSSDINNISNLAAKASINNLVHHIITWLVIAILIGYIIFK